MTTFGSNLVGPPLGLLTPAWLWLLRVTGISDGRARRRGERLQHRSRPTVMPGTGQPEICSLPP